jgi:sulfatase maturation enzyme AslB (radical SAM superfamily)
VDTIEQPTQWNHMIGEAKRTATVALRSGKAKEAQGLVMQLLAMAPADPEALLLAAQTDAMLGNLAPARAELLRALALAPGNPVLENQLRQLDQLEGSVTADAYTQQYLALRGLYLDYPMNIQLETVGRCNANCSFCPHEELERKYDEMDDRLFAKIIAEAATIPQTLPLNFFLNVINEPFMDKKIFERIALINHTIPRATLGFYTNLNVLPRDFFEKIRGVRNLTSVNVSFNAANKAEYEDSMRIDFDRTVGNLRRFLDANRDRSIVAAPVVLSRIATLDERDARFPIEVRALLPDFVEGIDYAVAVKRRANWLGQIGGDQTNIPQLFPCNQWLNISVFCDGTVPHCCMDAKGQFAFGNVKEKSLLEIYNSPEFRVLRETHVARRSVYPCNSCALA